jgi:hypothetical protein
MAVADVTLELAMVRYVLLRLAALPPAPLQIADHSLEMQLTAVAIDIADGRVVLEVHTQ